MRNGVGSSPLTDDPTITINDELGRSVRVPVRVDRIISLAPSVTELVFAAGGGDRLVGVTTYCNFPEQANSIGKVGDTMTPNLERIIALRPQLVIVSTASQMESLVEKLGRSDIAVYVLVADDIDKIAGSIRTLGELFGTQVTADRAAGDLTERLAKLRESQVGSEPVNVFVQISREPLFTIGIDSFLTNAIAAAGGRSVTSNLSSAYPKISKESAAKLDPSVIVLSESDDNREPNAAFSRSRAVKEGRVIKINADLLSRPGPRLIDALEQLSRAIKEIDAER